MENNKIHKLGLLKEDNPEFYNIEDKYNVIMQEWNRLNDDFNNWKQPKLFFEKERIRSYYKPVDELQSEFLNWKKLATEFLNKPRFGFRGEINNDTNFLFHINMLTDKKNNLYNNMVLLTNNFKVIQERYKSKVNFNIAIFSATISTIGLWIALWTLFR